MGAEPILAGQIASRAAGNPLFAVQIVADLVHRGVLVAGRQGFVLAAGAVVALPDDLHAAWSARVEDALEGEPPSARMDLERASVLGAEVDDVEWAMACEGSTRSFGAEGIASRSRLVEALLNRQLVRETERGFAFVHGLLRESIDRVSEQAGRLAGHHVACGLALAARAGADAGRASLVAERVGRHFLAAGRGEAAVDWLLLGAEHRLAVSRIDEVLSVLALAQRALAACPEADPRRVRWRLLRARVFRGMRELDLAEADAREVLAEGTRHEPSQGRLLLGGIHRRRARFELGEVSAARDAAKVDGDWRLVAEATEELGRTHLIQRGPTEVARHHWEEAVHAWTQAGDDLGRATSETYLALHLERAGDLERATALTERAIEVFARLGDRMGQAQGFAQLADVVSTILLNEAASRLEEGDLARADVVLSDARRRAAGRRDRSRA